MKAMSSPGSRSFPVTVTRLPVTPCQIRRRTVAYRPGSLSEVLTKHDRRAHPAALGSRPGGQSHRPHHPPTMQGTLPAEGGLFCMGGPDDVSGDGA